MPAKTSSGLDDAWSSRLLPGCPATSRDPELDPSVHGGLTNPLMRGLRDIFGRFGDQPDFRGLYERDIARRLYNPWARVGDSLRLALGKPITLVVTHPDGTRTSRVMAPDSSNEEYLAAVRQAEETVRGSDEDFLADQTVITATGEQADRLVAWIGRETRNVSEQR